MSRISQPWIWIAAAVIAAGLLRLPRLDQRRNLWGAHHQPKVEVGVALVGDNLASLLNHLF